MSLEKLKLSESEKFFIDRRRKDETQKQAATRLGICLNQYSKVERGLAILPTVVEVGELKDFETCVILRKRRGLSQQYIANLIERCVYWVRLMELGKEPADELVKFWKENG